MFSDDSMNALEVARYLNIGKNAVYQLAKTGELASYKLGRKLLFTRQDVDAYLASKHAGAASFAAQEQGVQGRDPVVADGSAVPRAHESAQSVAQAAGGNPEDAPFVIAGNDIAGDILANQLASVGMPVARTYRGSYVGLLNLYAGQADAALCHLYDLKTNSYNTPFVQRLVPGISVVVLRLYRRQQGFIVAEGNPKKIANWGSLLHEGVRLANRERGCGTRVLLDQKLRALEARAEDIEGYDAECASGFLAAARVQAGAADVCVGTNQVAQSLDGVQFIPLQNEWLDLVVAKTPRTRPFVRELKRMLNAEAVREEFARMIDGADFSSMGVITYEV